MKIILCVVAFILFMSATSYADLIRYTDQSGTLCFADDLSKVPKKYRQNIIRDQEESPVQVQDVGEQSRLTDTANNGNNDVVHICYSDGRMGLDTIYLSHNITCFLNARGYPYNLLKWSASRENKKTCAEYWCRLYKKDNSQRCITDTTIFSNHEPFVVIGARLYTGTGKDLLTILDRNFKVDPSTPIEWTHDPVGLIH
jgi:hypothetical protein